MMKTIEPALEMAPTNRTVTIELRTQTPNSNLEAGTYLLGPSPLSNRKRSHARLIKWSKSRWRGLRDLRVGLARRAEVLIS